MDESNGSPVPIDLADPKYASLAEAGLYIQTRHQTFVKVNIPPDCLAFQIGEAAQVASRGLLVATPHLVKSSNVPKISRNTFAVFLQPNVDHLLDGKLSFDEFTKSVMKRHYQNSSSDQKVIA